MNAVAVIHPQQSQISPAAPTFTMSDMERVALAIAKGGLFGSNDPNAVLTLCMLAQAEGQHPAVVFRDYHIISGKPAKKAEAMHRDFLAAGGKIEWHRCDDECADATFSHPQGGSMRITWDNARVQQAQLTGNAMHKKYPRQMKRSRVISEGVRSVFPMATSGLYETGEVQDIVAVQPARIAPPVPEAKRNRDMPAEPTDDPAAKWTAGYIAKVKDAQDRADLEMFADSKKTKLAELETARPELHKQCVDALDDRRADFAPEGKPDADMGEAFNGEPDWSDDAA